MIENKKFIAGNVGLIILTSLSVIVLIVSVILTTNWSVAKKEVPSSNVVNTIYVPNNTPTSTSVVSQVSTPTPRPASPTAPIKTSVELNSCEEINKPGEYSLVADITNTKSGPCIKFQDVSNVSLDCQNHTVTSKNEDYNIYVKGTSDFKIYNCKLISSVSLPSDRVQHVLRIEDSRQGELYSNTIGGSFVSVNGSTGVTIRNNIFTNEFSVFKSNNIVIKSNNFSFSNGGSINGGSIITLREGYNNSIISNTIDGKSDGIWHGGNGQDVGVDDGITMADENQLTIQGNIIQNIWDCGIEPTGNFFDSKIIGNNVKNAGYCLLGGWYWSSVKGNLIKDNIGDDMPRLFVFFRARGLRTNDQYVYFKDNTFENNKFLNPRLTTNVKGGGDGYIEASSFKIEAIDVPSSSIITGNNIFKNNNFTTIASPIIFTPASMIVDGGGNVCPTTADTNFPLKCN
ncbi:MAG: right-handed parallel beta-helix repeat-containing protein [Candidatus Niyogibacteria bacterium]|nr:right-handed parallel beta-helix repeat-containing protein [Candidatus Niyogibacteria bacterium]